MSTFIKTDMSPGDTIDNSIHQEPTFNIAVIGPVRSGKKTFIKSLFAESYSNNSDIIKYFQTDRTIVKTFENGELVRELVKESSNKSNKEQLSNNIIDEVGFSVPPIPDLFDSSIAQRLEQRIYAIPSLNSLNKEKLFQYVIDNF
jgi:septin family protein